MKKILSYALAATALMFAAAGCTTSPQDGISDPGYGTATLKIETDNTVAVIGGTRASAAPESYVVKVYSSEGLIYLFEGLDQVPEKLRLKSGDYTVKVKAGDDALLAEGPCYEGSQEFSISKGSVSVPVTCRIANTLISVAFDESIRNNFTSYGAKITVNDTTEIAFGPDSESVVRYLTLPKEQTSIGWTFEGTSAAGTSYTKSGKISPVKTATKYQLNYRYVESDKGGIMLNIEVDDTTVDIDDEIDIFQRPEITPLGFDIDATHAFTGSDFIFSITSSSEIRSILLEHSSLENGLEAIDNQLAAERGVTAERQSAGKVKLTVSPVFVASLPGGTNRISITATDSQNKSRTVVLKISISGINEIEECDIWATSLRVSAMIADKSASDVMFGYREAGSSDDWTKVEAEGPDSENVYSATITGLASGTSYECVAFIGGSQYGSPTCATTEQAVQLPNGGFEEWYQNKAWYPYAENTEGFWGTGNPMSTMMGASYNITTPENDPRPGSQGTRSAKLDSKFVGFGSLGKIAAGNMFTGESKGMSSGTNGVVAFGRPWSTRPKALTGWYKATVGTIDYAGSNSPAAKGETDVYQIFVCLTDWDEPHNVDTADQSTFFNPSTDSGVIAYGEIRSSQQVADWTEFTIELQYRSLSRKPKYIVVVATASAYGDYFTGSTGSVMCIDDFELVY